MLTPAYWRQLLDSMRLSTVPGIPITDLGRWRSFGDLGNTLGGESAGLGVRLRSFRVKVQVAEL